MFLELLTSSAISANPPNDQDASLFVLWFLYKHNVGTENIVNATSQKMHLVILGIRPHKFLCCCFYFYFIKVSFWTPPFIPLYRFPPLIYPTGGGLLMFNTLNYSSQNSILNLQTEPSNFNYLIHSLEWLHYPPLFSQKLILFSHLTYFSQTLENHFILPSNLLLSNFGKSFYSPI